MKKDTNEGSSLSNKALIFFALLLVNGFSITAKTQDLESTAEEKDQKLDNIITVTTQRRQESIQTVPITIDAFSERDIREIGAENINDLGRFTAGLETNNDTVTQPRYTIRGITTNDFGLGSDPAVGVYVDGIYVGRSGAAQLNFNDIERVEIIKGPQGTLFGRNAAAGAIHVITKKPSSDKEGGFQLTLGEYAKQKIEGYYNSEIGENAYFRGSFLANRRDGWIENNSGNDLDDEDNLAVRGALLWDYSPDTEVVWRADFDNVDQDAPQVASLNSGIAPADPFGSYETDILSSETRDVLGTSLTIKSEFEDTLFTSITGYREFRSTNLEEEDGSANERFFFATENREEQSQTSQEFRLQSNTQSDTQWLIGLSLFDEDADQVADVILRTESLDTFFLIDSGLVAPELVPNVPLGTGITSFLLQGFAAELEQLSLLTGIPVNDLAAQIAQANLGRNWTESTSNTLSSQSVSLYGDITYSVTNKLDLTFGLRYTYDKKDFTIFSEYQNSLEIPIPLVDDIPFGLIFFEQFSPAAKQKDNWSDFTPRLVAKYQTSDDLMFFFGLSQGFKAGGFNTLGIDPPFDPEKISNYEAGFKSSWLDNHLKFNLSIFHYDYKDLQILKLSGPPGQIPTYNVRNADAEGDGLEVEFSWYATDNLFFAANYGYLETEYTEYRLFPGESAEDDLTGQPLSSMPKNMFNASINYSLPLIENGELLFRADYSSVDDRVDGTGVGPLTIDSYELTNFRIAWTSAEADWDVALFVNNAFDEEYLLALGGQGSAIGSPTSRRGQPRFAGIEVGYRFW